MGPRQAGEINGPTGALPAGTAEQTDDGVVRSLPLPRLGLITSWLRNPWEPRHLFLSPAVLHPPAVLCLY